MSARGMDMHLTSTTEVGPGPVLVGGGKNGAAEEAAVTM